MSTGLMWWPRGESKVVQLVMCGGRGRWRMVRGGKFREKGECVEREVEERKEYRENEKWKMINFWREGHFYTSYASHWFSTCGSAWAFIWSYFDLFPYTRTHHYYHVPSITSTWLVDLLIVNWSNVPNQILTNLSNQIQWPMFFTPFSFIFIYFFILFSYSFFWFG